MSRCIFSLVASLVFCIPAQADTAQFRVGGQPITLPAIADMCVIDETTTAASQYFSTMAAAQSRMRNILKVILVPCAEKAIPEGRQAGVLSRWWMVFYNAASHKTPQDHPTFNTTFCNTLPGVLNSKGDDISKRLDSVGKEILQQDLKVDFSKPFLLDGSCIMPIQTTSQPIVYGAAATVVATGAWFVVANYTTDKALQPELIRDLLAYSDQIRTTNGGVSPTDDAAKQ